MTTTPWLYAGAPEAIGARDLTLMEGTTFCISDERGDIGARQPAGLFVRDTRVLSRWCLLVGGQQPIPMRTHLVSPHSALVLLRATSEQADLVIVRRRHIGDGMREDITVHNLTAAPVTADLSLDVYADFADLFEVKEGRAPAVVVHADTTSGRLDLGIQRDGDDYGVSVIPDGEAVLTSGRLSWPTVVPGHGSWSVTVEVVPRLHGIALTPHHPRGVPIEEAEPARRRRELRRRAPGLETGDANLASVLGHSIEDLATLRVFDPSHPEVPVVAAGAPWFMALFGRDSLLTSMMVMTVDPSLALGTLTMLGEHQGARTDPETEEQPGRILHELRLGPAGTLALGGKGAYYGSVDATPLFVMAVGELIRWHPDLLDDRLLRQVDRALNWMLTLGDSDGDGFLEYARSTGNGLVNQGWKDSWDGVNFADGTLPEAPIALAEVQGYAYAAYRARADIAEIAADPVLALEWNNRAEQLAVAFDDAFWLPDRGWYAIGLDKEKRPIDALTSNMGHCLWTGIVLPDRAPEVAARLISPELFSGWGVRTLATDMSAFNPMSYHNGSVWPHDTALCVAGLARYGFQDQARRIALGLLDAAHLFGGRLPELFAGFSREEVPIPVPYPAACMPQAWAAAAPIELLRALLRLEPGEGGLRCDGALPAQFLPLLLSNVGHRGRLYDIEVGLETATVRPVVPSRKPRKGRTD